MGAPNTKMRSGGGAANVFCSLANRCWRAWGREESLKCARSTSTATNYIPGGGGINGKRESRLII